MVLSKQNNPITLDPSYKMDLEFWDCFGRDQTPFSQTCLQQAPKETAKTASLRQALA